MPHAISIGINIRLKFVSTDNDRLDRVPTKLSLNFEAAALKDSMKHSRVVGSDTYARTDCNHKLELTVGPVKAYLYDLNQLEEFEILDFGFDDK